MGIDPYAAYNMNVLGGAGTTSAMTTTGTTGTAIVGPGFYPYPANVQMTSVPAQQIMLFVTPITNGFLVGEYGGLRNDNKFCKDYQELSEAIVALLVLKKLTQEK